MSTGSVDLTRSDPHILPSNPHLHLAPLPSVYERRVKPVLDRVLAILTLVLVSPLLIGATVAILATMGRPVLLRQHRVGRFGRVFAMYKFRTMIHDRREGTRPFSGVDRRTTHKHPEDPRITPVGRVLRKWSIDELPQLFNVILGNMSLVGPRPELVDIVARYEDWQHERHRVKPGITCIWQVSDRGDIPLHAATEVDLEYVDSISFLTDLRLLAMTPFAVLGLRRGS
ncbi:MAG TPA: sugar transferase [Acidimicrobiia bacterium]|nr:sugar transferase [Acidimicrobiia bacterium]